MNVLVEYLLELRFSTKEEDFIEILKITCDDIKFNRVGFGKVTSPEEFIKICEISKEVFLSC